MDSLIVIRTKLNEWILQAKEDLAWQVAAMIVNEVTSVTMGPPAGESN